MKFLPLMKYILSSDGTLDFSGKLKNVIIFNELDLFWVIRTFQDFHCCTKFYSYFLLCDFYGNKYTDITTILYLIQLSN